MTEHSGSEPEFFRQRGFGKRIGFGHRPALLVIDLIKAFTDPGRPLGADLGREIAAANRLIAACRIGRVPVLFATVRYDDPDLADAGIWSIKVSALSTLRASGDGSDIDIRLDRAPGDTILLKKYASCFFGTDLVSRLNSMGCDTVVMAGCTTSGCVRATAVDACQNGYRPMVVREAVGDRSERAHEQSLFDLEAKYADVVSLSETEASLRAPAARSADGRTTEARARRG